jgi:hypothetical protein
MVLNNRDHQVPETVRQLVLEALHSRRFNTVREVVRTLEVSGVKRAVTLKVIQDLAREGKVILNLPGAPDDALMAPVASLKQYLGSRLAMDLWLTLSFLVLGIMTTFLIPTLFPVVIIRWIFSGILLLFIPGFAFVRSLYPFDRFIDYWERLALSIGLSIALDLLVAFLLNFSPWGITIGGNPIPVVIGIALVTLLSILVATYRRVKVLREEKPTA